MLRQKEAGLTVKSGMGTPAGPASKEGLWTMEDCLYHFCHRFNFYLLYPPEIISIRMDNFRAYIGNYGEKQSFLWGEYELRVCYRKQDLPGDQCRVKVLAHSFCYLYRAEERHGEERLYTPGENGIETSGLTCEANYQSSSSRASFFPLLYVVNLAVEGRVTPAAATSFSESELLFDMQEEAEKRCCACCRELPQPAEDECTVPPIQDDAAAAAGGAFAAQAAAAVIVDDPGAGEADPLETAEDSSAAGGAEPVPAEPAAAEPGQTGENVSSRKEKEEKVYSCPSPPSHDYYRTYRLFYEAFGLGRDCC